jgi:hypothetical protein
MLNILRDGLPTAVEPVAQTTEPVPDYAETADGQFAMF